MAKLLLKDGIQSLVLCEGADAKFFLIWLIDYYIRQGRANLNSVQVEDFGGIKQLTNSLGAWKNISGFSRIKSLCVVRDAETDFSGAEKSVQDSLLRNSFPVPGHAWEIKQVKDFRCAYLLFPGLRDGDGNYISGTLEDLCLHILNDAAGERKLECIGEFLVSCGDKFSLCYPRLHKTKLHEYLVMHDKYVDAKIGEAARMGAFDFESKAAKNIIDVLSNLLK
ncbi:MAG: hypothetical protein IJU95_07520 [Treponema sp.]|nr:hypothetical protein [Treponema sp.]